MRSLTDRWIFGRWELGGPSWPRRQRSSHLQRVWLDRLRRELAGEPVTHGKPRGLGLLAERAAIQEGASALAEDLRALRSAVSQLAKQTARSHLHDGDGVSSDARRPMTTSQSSTSSQDAQGLALVAMAVAEPTSALSWAQRALDLDGACVDALVVAATLDSKTWHRQIGRLKQAVLLGDSTVAASAEAGRRVSASPLGATPQLRARRSLAQALWQAKHEVAAIQHYERLLELDPADNLLVREDLIAAYLARGDLSNAARLLRTYVDSGSGVFRWALVLERFLSKDEGLARQLRDTLDWQNPHVAPLLAGRRRIPDRLPTYDGRSGEAVAVGCALVLREAWRRSPAASRWLRRR